MDLYDELEAPGGDDFRDVQHIFEEGSREMDVGEVLLTEGFDLQDAMSAFEIGEPRLDSGMMSEQDRGLLFEPRAPLLPAELCWILDKSFAAEVEWHAGHTLSQSIYSILHVHHLEDINPGFIAMESELREQPGRPFELVFIVLRAAIFGLLKCCDLSWRELNKNRVFETEDWHAEKCEVSLLEGIQPRIVLGLLDGAIAWLSDTPKVTFAWKQSLNSRLLLRKALLELMLTNPCLDPPRFQLLISTARGHLRSVRTHLVPEPAPDSQARFAVDGTVIGRLHSMMPLRPLDLRPQPDVWDNVEAFLAGLEDLRMLSSTFSISTWETVGYLHLWSPRRGQERAYLRSLTQSTFYNDILVLERFGPSWVLDRYCRETVTVSFSSIAVAVKERWSGPGESPLPDLERFMVQLLISHIRAFWSNQPRHRRHLMKAIASWQDVYDNFSLLCSNLNPQSRTGLVSPRIIDAVPQVILHWILCMVREIVFSGFQLDLYIPDEKPGAYWYAAQILGSDVVCLDRLIAVVPRDSLTYEELAYQRDVAKALQAMSQAMFAITAQTVSAPGERTKLNFTRRYKWTLGPEAQLRPASLLTFPTFEQFVTAFSNLSDAPSPPDLLQQARDHFFRVLESTTQGRAEIWSKDRTAFVRRLMDTSLCARPQSVGHLPGLNWDPYINPWFPVLQE